MRPFGFRIFFKKEVFLICVYDFLIFLRKISFDFFMLFNFPCFLAFLFISLFFLFFIDCVSFHFLFCSGSLHSGRSKVARVTVGRDILPSFRVCKVGLTTLKVAINTIGIMMIVYFIDDLAASWKFTR